MADNHPFRIAITAEEPFLLEPIFITEILNHGWDMVHLRHPSASLTDMRNLIESIPSKYHCRLRLHGHFELIYSFNLGGIHLNRRCPCPPENYSGPYSRSCHSIEEVKKSIGCDYVTLSPVFDSISKNGYKGIFYNINLKQNNKAFTAGVTTKVIALGGVDSNNITTVSQLGFDGYAVLGALMTAESLYELRLRLDRFDKTGQHTHISD